MFKKLVLAVFLVISFCGFLKAEANDGGTDVIVIGTVHEPTDSYNPDTLISILKRINPDIILVECDTSYLNGNSFKEHIKDITLETRALTRYSEMNSFEMHPYDINERDKYLDSYERREKEAGFFRDIDRLYSGGKLTNSAVSMLGNIIDMMGMAEKMVNSNALYINAEGSTYIDTINYYSYNGIARLIDEAPELASYKQYWDNEYSFWVERNNVMLQNILNYKNNYAGKKIVVLCGFAHKNILKNGLSEKARAENINVKEYWEY